MTDACEVSADETWGDQYTCNTHRIIFFADAKRDLCPVGDTVAKWRSLEKRLHIRCVEHELTVIGWMDEIERGES